MSKDKQTTEHYEASDASGDWKFFTVTPRLVWAMARTPFDFMLWVTVKDIAGSKAEGVCYLGAEDLATLARMSVGKVVDSRGYLLAEHLLTGELRSHAKGFSATWHLSVPDLWRRNLEWAEKHPSIAERIAFIRFQVVKVSGGVGAPFT